MKKYTVMLVGVIAFVTILTFLSLLSLTKTDDRALTNPSLNTNITSNNSLQQYGVEILPSSAPDFNQTLLQYTGGNSVSLALAEMVKPFSVFIRNNSPKNIVGIRLKWVFLRPSGEQKTTFSGQDNPGILEGARNVPLEVLRENSLIRSNDMRFFNYLNDSVDGSIYLGWQAKRFESRIDPKSFQDIKKGIELEKNKLLGNFSNVIVSIDSVVFEDGAFTGANEDFYFESLTGHLKAHRDIVNEIRNLKTQGRGSGEIVSRILSYPHVPRNPDNGPILASPKASFDNSYSKKIGSLKREISYKQSRGVPIDKIIGNMSAYAEPVIIHRVK